MSGNRASTVRLERLIALDGVATATNLTAMAHNRPSTAHNRPATAHNRPATAHNRTSITSDGPPNSFDLLMFLMIRSA